MIYTNLHFVDLKELGYGHRIFLFSKNNPPAVSINPSDEIGKLGIRIHTPASKIFHKTIKITAKDCTTSQEIILYLNRSSAIKWINAQNHQNHQNHQLNLQASHEQITDSLNQLFNKSLNKENLACLNHAKVHSNTTKIQGLYCKMIMRLTASSWGLFKLRMKLLTSSEKHLKNYSEALACDAFKQAKASVPAYRDFISSHKIVSFSDIPPTSKDNYIKEYVKREKFGELSLYSNCIIPPGSKKDTSTGTSGKPTSWYRGPQEIREINRSICFSAKMILGDRPYYFINGFALGPWATGIAIANAAATDSNATVCNIGLDTQEIFQAIKDAINILPPKHPIIVAGYPPHLKEVVELSIKEGFSLDDHEVIGIVGGESISESQRELILAQPGVRTGFSKCYSAYGASDLDVAIGYETDFAIELRQHLHQNAKLAKEMLGDSEFVPMIFPYNPLNYHIETDADQNLIYTCVRGDRISPRIRYNLGDRGKIMPHSDLMAILKKHGIKMKSRTLLPLPFLFVWGRVGTHVSLEGLKIAPENLDDALRSEKLFPMVQHYGFLQFERNGNKGIEILIEMEETSGQDHELIHEKVIQGLRRFNQEFNKLMSQGRPQPTIRIYQKGTSPMSLQREKYPHRKKQYIFNDGDEFVRTSFSPT